MKKTNTQYKSALKALIDLQAKKPVELTYGDEATSFKIVVNPIISFKKRCEMIKFIVDSVFTSGIDTIQSYTPEYEEFAKRCAVMQYYTDLKMPTKLDDIWLLLNQTTVYFDTVAIVGDDEINTIFQEARNAIEARKEYLANKTDINTLFEKVGKTVESVGQDFSKADLTSLLDMLKNMPMLSETQVVEGILNVHKNQNSEKE